MVNRIVLSPDLEASQPLGQMTGDLTNRSVALAPIGRGKVVEQPRSSAGERDFKVKRKRFVIESSHTQTRTKIEH